MRRWLFIILLVLLNLNFVMAEKPLIADAKAEIPDYDLADRFSFGIAGGYSFSMLNFDFHKGTLYNETIIAIDNDDQRDGYFALSLNFKYNFFKFFAVGICLDYNVMPINKVEVRAESENYLMDSEGDIGDLHVLSGFVYFQLFIDLGPWVPYFQFGLGVNGLFEDFDTDVLELKNNVTFGLYIAGGLEFFVQQLDSKSKPWDRDFSIFAEARWHHNLTDVSYFPDGTENREIKGDATFDNVTLLVGINIYFGFDKPAEEKVEEEQEEEF